MLQVRLALAYHRVGIVVNAHDFYRAEERRGNPQDAGAGAHIKHGLRGLMFGKGGFDELQGQAGAGVQAGAEGQARIDFYDDFILAGLVWLPGRLDNNAPAHLNRLEVFFPVDPPVLLHDLRVTNHRFPLAQLFEEGADFLLAGRGLFVIIQVAGDRCHGGSAAGLGHGLLNTLTGDLGYKGGCQVGKFVVDFYGTLQPVLRLAMVKGIIHGKSSPEIWEHGRLGVLLDSCRR